MSKKSIPDQYYCELCRPRLIDHDLAKSLQDKYLASKGNDVQCQGGLGKSSKSPNPAADHANVTGATSGVADMVNNQQQLPTQQPPAQELYQQRVQNDSINQIPAANQNLTGQSQDDLAMNEGKVLTPS